MSLSKVSVRDPNLCAIREVPVNVHTRHSGAAQDLDTSTVGVEVHFVSLVTKDTKRCDVRDEVYSGITWL